MHKPGRGSTESHFISLRSVTTRRDPRLPHTSRLRTPLVQIRYDGNCSDAKALLRLASTLSRPRARFARPQRPSNYLLIENLNDNITEAFLTRTLTRIDQVRQVCIPTLDGRRQGIASVQLPSASDPEVFISQLNAKPLCGMKIAVLRDVDASKFRTKWKKIVKDSSNSNPVPPPPAASLPLSCEKAETRAERGAASLGRKNPFSQVLSPSPSLLSPRAVPSAPNKLVSGSRTNLKHSAPPLYQDPARETAPGVMKMQPQGVSTHATRTGCRSPKALQSLSQNGVPAGVGSQLFSNNPNMSTSAQQRQRRQHHQDSERKCWRPALCISCVDADLDSNLLMVGFSSFYPDLAIKSKAGSWIITFRNITDRDAAYHNGCTEYADVKMDRVDYFARTNRSVVPNKRPHERFAAYSSVQHPPAQRTNVKTLLNHEEAMAEAKPEVARAHAHQSAVQHHLERSVVTETEHAGAIPDAKDKTSSCRDAKTDTHSKAVFNNTTDDTDVVSAARVAQRLSALIVAQASRYITVNREHQLQSIVNQKVLRCVENVIGRGKHRTPKSDTYNGKALELCDDDDTPLSSTHYSLDEYLRSGTVSAGTESGKGTKSSHTERFAAFGRKSVGGGDFRHGTGPERPCRKRETRATCVDSSNLRQRDAKSSETQGDKGTSDINLPMRSSTQEKTGTANGVASSSDKSGQVVSSAHEQLFNGEGENALQSEPSENTAGSRELKAEMSSASYSVKAGSNAMERSDVAHELISQVKRSKHRCAGKKRRPFCDQLASSDGVHVTSLAVHPSKRLKAEMKSDDISDDFNSAGPQSIALSAEPQSAGSEKPSSVTEVENVSSSGDATGTGSNSARTAGYLRKDWQSSLRRTATPRPGKSRLSYSSRESRQQSRLFRKQLSLINPKHDLFTANSLKQRKKPLQYRKSVIHGMGLFSIECIEEGEFITEYIGEVVRNSVANMRQEKYTRRGMGDSYLFRLSNGTVVDATYKGCIARFINHSCDPNIVAKIISVDGLDKIVFYSKRLIREDEELTYDYKFDYEADNQKIPCLCGAWNCRKFLN